MRFLNWTLEHPVAISVFYVVVAIIGAISIYLIPIELSPNIKLPQFTVNASWPGQSAIEMEAIVNARLESIMYELNDVSEVFSKTTEGNCRVIVKFKQGTNLELNELILNEKINTLSKKIPKEVSLSAISKSAPREIKELEGFLEYKLVSTREIFDIQKYAQEKIINQLSSIKGVKSVSIKERINRLLNIEIDRVVVERFNLNVQNVLSLLSEQSGNIGQIKRENAYLNIARVSNLISINNLENIPLKLASGRILKLADIADIFYSYEPPRSISCINGQNVINIKIEKEKGFDLIKTAKRVEEKIHHLKYDLPADIKIIETTNKSYKLNSELEKLIDRSFFSILFIFVLFLIVFKNVKSSLILLSSIFLSVLGATTIFYLFGYSLNILTFAGFTMGFGILVDNAIVVYEHIHRNVFASSGNDQKSQTRNKISETVIFSTREMFYPLLASNLTTIGAFIPVLLLSSGFSMYIRPFCLALFSTIVISQIVSFTLIPLLIYYKLFKEINLAKQHYFPGEKFYRNLLMFCSRYRKTLIFIIIWLFGIPIFLFPDRIEPEIQNMQNINQDDGFFNKGSYESLLNRTKQISAQASNQEMRETVSEKKGKKPGLNWFWQKYNQWWGNEKFCKDVKPWLFNITGGIFYRYYINTLSPKQSEKKKKNYIYISIEIPNMIHISNINNICIGFEKIAIQSKNKIDKIITNIQSSKYATIRINIKSDYLNTLFPKVLYGILVNMADNIGGASIVVSGAGSSYYQGLETARTEAVIILKGPNYNKLQEITKSLVLDFKKNKRFRNVNISDMPLFSPKQFEAVYKLGTENNYRYNFDHRNVVNNIRSHIINNSYFNLYQSDIKLRIGIKNDGDLSFAKISEILVRDEVHHKVSRIKDLGRFSREKVPLSISRTNQAYICYINLNYLAQKKYMDQAINNIINKISLPYGYSINSFGTKNFEPQNLILIIFFSIFVVWIISACLFESFKKPFLILLAIPLSWIGYLFGLYLFDVSMSTGTYLSFLFLTGIVVNNSIILINHISIKLSPNKKNIPAGIIDAASNRVRPIFLTTITTIVALLPLVLNETQQSLSYTFAIGTIGGMVSSTIFILILIPVIFLKMNRE